MRNLLATRWTKHQIFQTEPSSTFSASAWDPSSDTFICAFGPSRENPVVEINRVKDGCSEKVTSWNHEAESTPDSQGGDRILDMKYFVDNNTVCLIFSGGDIVLIRENPSPNEGKIEIMGSVDGGIEAASWSPDEEVLALLSGKGHFVLMSRDLEEISDVSITSDDLKISSHVNVGWGKAATQFKGKRAAAMRDPTMPEKVDEGLLTQTDNRQSRLSWRGDGAFVALSSIDQDRRRVIRVFGRSGELESVSEPVDFLGDLIAWKPSGSLIASVQYPENGNPLVVFFERNGLRHGGFPLRGASRDCTGSLVRDISWNADSTILAICFGNKVQLWTTGNYHWYLKREIIGKSPIDSFSWHPEKALDAMYHNNGFVHRYSFVWSTVIGGVLPPADYGQVAVTDGGTLKLTPLKFVMIPPPMAFREVNLTSTPLAMAFSKSGLFLAVLHDTSVDILSWDVSNQVQRTKPELWEKKIEITQTDVARQICFCDDEQLFILSGNGRDESRIVVFESNGGGTWEQRYEKVFQETILRLIPGWQHQTPFYEDESGLVTGFSNDGSIPWNTRLPEPCPWVQIYNVDETTIAFGLSENGKLYANSRLLSTGCTSFLLTSDHVVFTTSSHFLKFVHLSADIEALKVPNRESEEDERCRSVERGARIVSIMPSIFGVTLQMPRGNLETIFPRVLVLAGIRGSIDNLDYRAAFHICRTHRVDMNILYDYNPDQFMLNVERFVRQLENPSFLDLFLSQIRNEDLSQTAYRRTLPKPLPLNPKQPGLNSTGLTIFQKSKVNTICDAFLKILETRVSTHLHTMITAYVCKEPPDFDNALKTISRIHNKDTRLSEAAVEHIIFLSDSSKLYDNALGLYDIDLALLIAERSQRDPREYLPFLQSLQDMSLQRKKFTIDDLLERHSKALGHLIPDDNTSYDEFKTYMTKHNLYQTALELVRLDVKMRNDIMLHYANYLNDISNFKEAAIAFEFLGAYGPATEAWRKAGMWQQALYCSLRASQGESEVKQLAESFAETLFETKDYQSSAKIYLDYLDNIEAAIRALCKGHFFEEAMRIAAKQRRFNLVEDIIDVELVEAFNATTEFVVDCKEQITAQLRRLRELHSRKAEDPLAFFDGQIQEDIPDNVSLAMTNISTFGSSIYTRYTGKTRGTAQTTATRRTEKNQRREDRKKARGKKGTVYEAEYLFASLKRLIERVDRTQSDATRLIEALVRRSMKERAESVQHGMNEVLKALEGSRSEIIEVMVEDLSVYEAEGPPPFETASKLPELAHFEPLSILSLQGYDRDAKNDTKGDV